MWLAQQTVTEDKLKHTEHPRGTTLKQTETERASERDTQIFNLLWEENFCPLKSQFCWPSSRASPLWPARAIVSDPKTHTQKTVWEQTLIKVMFLMIDCVEITTCKSVHQQVTSERKMRCVNGVTRNSNKCTAQGLTLTLAKHQMDIKNSSAK